MEESIGKYDLKPLTEEEFERLTQDPKTKELEMLWDILHDDDGEPLSEVHSFRWLEIVEKLDI